MKKTFAKFIAIALLGVLVLFSAIAPMGLAYAEKDEEAENNPLGTSISISPVSKVLQLSPDSTYEDIFSITNDGSENIRFEVYAAPYSYIYSEENDTYTLGFSQENNYTQITRWISVKDKNGNYTSRPTFVAKPGETVEVTYRIATPSSIPDGGQYAVLFAHTLSDSSNVSGIKTEASPGMVIYGRSDGESIISSGISDMKINRNITRDAEIEENGQTITKEMTLNNINASAKVKNTGNLDFNARGVLKVEGVLGGTYYETPENESRISIIPEAELTISDEWEETPSFGLYKVTWTVTAGDQTETSEMILCLVPPSIIIISIILLTIVIAWIIMVARKRKERRSRFAI